ncbi:LLM class flavin-dependent oxidoreductase [Paenibacillus sp. NFR01]|uniref:LLM class flavin-dependent oxidoreductase n=1 Tax=Paenibacillus sp. NFR01 TaxID=1566279 RepID=UPI0008B7F7D9|nr:LLM class flavin-dependent oxidoreductase [Paenibacillus sp. NFR01]SEU11466.1 luciferase family oxidoreductase, group 1 [Paenibacillus sp. NFR01]
MKQLRDIPVSVLDLAPIVEGGSAAEALRNSLDLATRAEGWGYRRFWVAEHHSMPGIASSATSVVIGHIAAGTQTIRVGSGGIMLSNHAPLAVAEQFGTLESLFPGRIDLGLGRAPGSDQAAARALRRGTVGDGSEFPEQLSELRAYFDPEGADSRPRGVHAVPGEGLDIPIWLLGSSGFSARLAAQLGLPFAFASHFAPEYLLPALELYRTNFRPSAVLDKPYVMVGLGITAADTAAEAARLATSQQQQFLNLVRGRPGKLQQPVDSMDELWTPYEKSLLAGKQQYSIHGDKASIKERLQQMLAETDADEWIVASQIYDHQARLRSYELVAEALREI